MLNPALTEIMANDRLKELQQTGPNGSSRTRSLPTEIATAPRASLRSIRHDRLVDSQRAIGWFLVSVGLRLVVPRTRTGSAR